ncbi:MAG TPA: di-heme oxidoredictase family protein, partial [Rheinheimera sp.]|nr:di-heme oxidoredictase family protein [Rheinheimera sp.]
PTCAAMTAWQTDNAYVAAQPLSNRFVTYRTYWTDSQLRFTVVDNGVEYDMYDAPISITAEASELQQPFYLLANLAVGGNFTDAASNAQVSAPLPGKMYIDYIRVYQLNGQGQVFSGNINPPETGSFGVFTDSNSVDNALQAGVSSDIYIWNQSSVTGGNTAPAEGNNVIAWHYVAPNQWFGGGIQSRQLRDLSNFANGTMTFRIKIPADISFKIGIADNYTNENWLTFPAHETKYGLVRSGDWAQATIPVADLRGSLIALQALSGMFYIASVDGQLPGYSFQFAIDDIVWHGGGSSGGADSDGDGVADSADQCSNTPSGSAVDSNGCPTAAGAFGVAQTAADSVRFFVNSGSWADVHYKVNNGGQINVAMQQSGGVNQYSVSGLPAAAELSYFFTYWDTTNGYAVDTAWQSYTLGDVVNPQPDPEPDPTPEPGQDSDGDGIADTLDSCSGTPAGTPVNANGCPLTSVNVVPLYNSTTPLEGAIQYDRGDALVTRFSDRARDRHAKENHFQAYDHYLTFYWEDRTAAIEIVDYVAKGGSSIRMNVVTQNKLDDLQAENRWWYIGINTLAEFCGNGVMNMVDYTHYWKEESYNCREGRPIQLGDKLEFEVSQFLDGSTLPRGRANYYGTTFLYIVGQGIVPWDVTDKEVFQPGRYLQRDSVPLPASARLGGDTTLHVQMTAEPDGHFQQMATNLGYANGQPFVLGRRVHHSSVLDGSHDENAENGSFAAMAGLAGSHYINPRCSGCHVRNGRAPVAGIGEPLDKWVFKVGNAQGLSHAELGRVLQPRASGSASGEGMPSIAAFTESNGLRTPHYQFGGIVPETFSARIAPQLNGIGLLEAIPEAAILALEDGSDANGDGISGRAQRVIDPVSGETRLGRFGYKAATSSVKHQLAAAFNSDMGVMTAMLPTPDCGANQSDCSAGPQLPEQQLADLVKYISLLGVRPQRDYNEPQVMQGQTVFNTIGCNGCHVESFQTSEYHPLAELRNQTIRPYTDLLLHDMGPGLADNLAEGEASGAEWRTAPLWGLGLSACVTGGVACNTGWDAFGLDGHQYCTPNANYLHDGRARTIDEAIRWHGGEAEISRVNYQNLPAADKTALLAFLNSL